VLGLLAKKEYRCEVLSDYLKAVFPALRTVSLIEVHSLCERLRILMDAELVGAKSSSSSSDPSSCEFPLSEAFRESMDLCELMMRELCQQLPSVVDHPLTATLSTLQKMTKTQRVTTSASSSSSVMSQEKEPQVLEELGTVSLAENIFEDLVEALTELVRGTRDLTPEEESGLLTYSDQCVNQAIEYHRSNIRFKYVLHRVFLFPILWIECEANAGMR